MKNEENAQEALIADFECIRDELHDLKIEHEKALRELEVMEVNYRGLADAAIQLKTQLEIYQSLLL